MKKTAKQIAYEVLSKVADSSMLPATVGKPTYAKPQQGAAVGSLRGVGKAPMGGELGGRVATPPTGVASPRREDNQMYQAQANRSVAKGQTPGKNMESRIQATAPKPLSAPKPSEQQVALQPKKR